jgi:hypothetical protein
VPQYTDPEVSRLKFDRELAEFQSLQDEYRSRGWILISSCYPELVVMLCAVHLVPSAVITGVRFDYTNYDAEPPSVKFVNPFTSQAYLAKEVPQLQMNRAIQAPPVNFPGVPGGQIQQIQLQPYVQSYGPEEEPFLCVAGVREYHKHPAHSGDSWELHRRTGAGRFARILDLIHTYAVAPSTYMVNLSPQVSVGVPQERIPN